MQGKQCATGVSEPPRAGGFERAAILAQIERERRERIEGPSHSLTARAPAQLFRLGEGCYLTPPVLSLY